MIASALHRREVQVAAHQVLAFLREEHQVAGRRVEHLAAVGEPHFACAFGEEVEEGDVLRRREALAHARQAVFAADAPRRGELGVEVDGAFEAHRLQDVRQGIHGVSSQEPRRFGQDAGRRASETSARQAP